MDLLDRAAQALATPYDWDGLDAANRNLWRARVRQVLRALHDPDERMAEAGAEIVRNVGREQSEEAYRSDAANAWRFMIDALLSEKK